jgi:hypothetical protein
MKMTWNVETDKKGNPTDAYLFVGTIETPVASMHKRVKFWAGLFYIPGASLKTYAEHDKMKEAIEVLVSRWFESALDESSAP